MLSPLVASWLAAPTTTRAREPNITSQDLTLNALPVTTRPIYLGVEMHILRLGDLAVGNKNLLWHDVLDVHGLG